MGSYGLGRLLVRVKKRVARRMKGKGNVSPIAEEVGMYALESFSSLKC